MSTSDIATSLADRECVACTGETPRLTLDQVSALQRELGDEWLVAEGKLARHYSFTNFVKALDFVNRVGALAEQVGHHPDLYLTWGKARVEIYTHAVGGLTEADFILAAKISRLKV